MMEVVTPLAAPRAPAAGSEPRVTTIVRGDGVALLTLADPRGAHNTLTPELVTALEAALDAARGDARVRAIVLASAKKGSFLVGVDLAYLKTVRFASEAAASSLALGELFARVAASDKPVVACVHGAALAGGFELALACAAAIATLDPRTALGLPEVKVGLLPAAGGLLRVAERAGLSTALDLGLSGRSLTPHAALSLGLVDEVVAPDGAVEAACRLAVRLVTRPRLRAGLAERRAWLRHRGSAGARLRDAERALLDSNPLGRAVLFRRARLAAARETRGHYPATERILEVLERQGSKGFDAAARLASQHVGELVVSETSRRLVELFFAHAATRSDPGVLPEERAGGAASPVERVERVAVVGAGLMGAGIAYVTVAAGLPVSLKDPDSVALGRGLKYVKDVLDERARQGALGALERDHAFSRLSGNVDYAGIGAADLVIEAVFEELAHKRAVRSELERRVKDTCVLASNTSSLPISLIAEGSSRPDRILGMHYFTPVHRVPLLEVVRTKDTDPRAVATAVAVGKRQGKTVIVVRDGTAFYATRILVAYLGEATRLLTDGVAIGDVDRALLDWGFPVGPLHQIDDLGLDLVSHVALALHGAFGDRLRAPSALAALRADHRLGRKNGRGFYLYGRGPRAEKRVDDTVYQALHVRPSGRLMPEELSLRCSLALVNEALRCLDEGVLLRPRDGDVGAVYGAGFPAFRGGPFRYVDVLGAPEVLRRTRSLEQRFGARFEPAPLLVEMARKGRRFYD
jgi:3-hydroxyacyl-CoA dehydrogenase/enoyl-CoA hydratase/3-hydroxybutyryl-CoA epimerase